MKNYLKESAWWNNPIDNPTQTRYTRFMKVPHGEMDTMFNKIGSRFKTFGGLPKTRYDELMEGIR